MPNGALLFMKINKMFEFYLGFASAITKKSTSMIFQWGCHMILKGRYYKEARQFELVLLSLVIDWQGQISE